MKRLAAVTAVMLLVSLNAWGSTWIDRQTENMHRMSGPFVSDDYGFSVRPSAASKAYVTNGGDANHGLVVILGNERAIYVYPEYIGLVDGDGQPCKPGQFPWEPTSRRINSSIVINGVKECDVEFTSGDVIRKVIEISTSLTGEGIMYTLCLRTNRANLAADNAAFVALAKTFKKWRVVL